MTTTKTSLEKKLKFMRLLRSVILNETKTVLMTEQVPPPPDPNTTEMDTSDPTTSGTTSDMPPVEGGDDTMSGDLDLDGGASGGGGSAGLDGDGLEDGEDGLEGEDDFGGDVGGFGGFGGGGGGFSGGGDDDFGGDDEDGDGGGDAVPPSEPDRNPDDPVGAAVEEAKKLAGETSNVPDIVNAVKASIQVNFGDYQEAWPIVQQLKDENDKVLSAVADRVGLFIAGVLEEGKKREKKSMKITEAKLKEMIKEALEEQVQNASDYDRKFWSHFNEFEMKVRQFNVNLSNQFKRSPQNLSDTEFNRLLVAIENIDNWLDRFERKARARSQKFERND